MTEPHSHDVAVQLAHAMVRLRARLRTESAPTDPHWTWAQITTLSRIAKEEPTTTSALAAAEHVRPQSMASTVSALLAERLITRKPDPNDGRKSLIVMTAKGRKLLVSTSSMRETWLETVIEKNVSQAERRTLSKAAQIMERLADS